MKKYFLICMLTTLNLLGQNNKMKTDKQSNLETITLAGGCYWCVEAIYENLVGVKSAVSGFTGGTTTNPSYEEVCSGRTGHAEAVQVHFDTNVVSYRDLLNVFFAIHDPTTLNRQGADVGTQYRSAIFYHDHEQKNIAEELIENLNAQNIWDKPIVTEVVPLDKLSHVMPPSIVFSIVPFLPTAYPTFEVVK